MTDIEALLAGAISGAVLLFLITKMHIVTDWFERGRGYKADWPDPPHEHGLPLPERFPPMPPVKPPLVRLNRVSLTDEQIKEICSKIELEMINAKKKPNQ